MPLREELPQLPPFRDTSPFGIPAFASTPIPRVATSTFSLSLSLSFLLFLPKIPKTRQSERRGLGVQNHAAFLFSSLSSTCEHTISVRVHAYIYYIYIYILYIYIRSRERTIDRNEQSGSRRGDRDRGNVGA